MLFFDDLHASPPDLQRAQLAAKQFVKAGIGPGAQAAVYSVTAGLTLDFTADPAALTAAIEKIHSHQRLSDSGLMPCPRISPYQAFLIVNNDGDALNAAVQEAQQCRNADSSTATVTGRNPSLSSVRPTTKANPNLVAVQAQANTTWEKAREDSLDSFDAVNKALTLLAHAPGTRVLLMVSTGFLSGLMENEKTAAIDRAVHDGIVINGLDAKGLWSEIPGREAQTVGSLPLATFFFETSTMGSRNDAVNAVMQEFASGTGGLFFHNSNDLVEGFSQLGSVPETTYLIAFRPDSEGPAGRYRKLKVRLAARNGDYVQARPGYITPNLPAETPQESRPIDQLVMAADVPAQFPVKLTPSVNKTGAANSALSLLIHVDLAALKFNQRDDRHVQKLVFIGAIFDAGGKIVAAKEGAMDFALKDETFTRLTGGGVNAALTLNAPPGSYRVRVVVADAEGKVAAINQNIEIPQ
jgi:VWFA-related protein